MDDINKFCRIDLPLDRRHTDFLLTVRHFAELCGVILVLPFFAFSGLPMESGLLCCLASVFQRKEPSFAPAGSFFDRREYARAGRTGIEEI